MAFGGLQNWFKKRVEDVRDVFDANTVADQQRRLAAGQPRMYQAQQAQRNQQSLQAPQKRNLFEQAVYNATGGFGGDVLKAPSAVLDFKASLDRTPAGQVMNLTNPLNLGKNITEIGKDVVTNKPVGTTTMGQLNKMQSFARGSQDLIGDKFQQSRFGERQTDNRFVGGAARAIGNVGGQVALTMASGGTALPSTLMGARTFSDQQQAAQKAGKSNSAAFGIGALQGGIEAGLEKVSLDKLANPGAGNFLARTGKRFLTEGSQEGTQQFAQNLITNKTYNPNQSLKEGVKESAIFGGIAGGVAGSAFDFNPSRPQVAPTKTQQNSTPDNDVTSRMMLDYFKGRTTAPNNSATGQGAMAPVSLGEQRLQLLMQEAKAKANLGQEGFIKLTEDNTAQPLKPQGFIVKETKPRNGRVDTVRISKGPDGKMQSTIQTELTPEAKQYAETFNLSPEQAVKDLQNIGNVDTSGTTNALAKVQNSGKNNVVKDLQDQQDYGVKEIQDKPTNTIDDVFAKYLDTQVLTDEQLNKSNRGEGMLGGVRRARDAVGKANVLRIVNDAAARGLERTSRGGAVARKLTRVAQYINKNAGQDPAIIEAAKKYAGEGVYADSSLLQIGKQAYDLLPNDSTRARAHAVLDPESADGAVKFDDLTPQEKQAAAMLRDLGDAINDTSYRTGFISRAKWESNRGGRYIARLYNEVAASEDVADLLELPDKRGLFLGMYKSRTDLNNDLKQRLIRDPIKLAIIRARQVRSNEALLQYMSTAEAKGYVRNSPTPGFIKVTPQNRMANWAGKYVRQDVYENVEGFKALGQGMNALNNILDVYDGNPARRLRKKMLTIYNPVVRAGNVTSNYFFAYLNGINPLTFQKNKIWAQGAIKKNDPLVIASQRSGLIGNDIVRTDKNIFNKDKAFQTELDKNKGGVIAKVKNAPRTVDDKLSERYGGADDKAKLAAVKTWVDRGYSVNEAIAKTAKGFQDYSRVGHAYDLAAKMPVFGNAFVRFQGDLYVNILKNAAVDHPVRLGALLVGIAGLGDALSKISGESPEDKKTREDRAGAPKIPFTNISTEFQTPWGAVDAARFTPLYMRQDINGNSLSDNISRLSPVNVFNPFNINKQELVKKAASDPLIGPVISIVGDTDWRGKSVADPEGVRNGQQLYPDNPLSAAEQNRNRLQYAVRSYAPYPANEVGDILAFNRGDSKTEQVKPGGKGSVDNTGKPLLAREGYNTGGSKKTVGQGLARLFGIRAEKFGKDEAAAKRENDALFAYFDKQDQFKNTLDSETRKAFDNRHASSRTRDGIQQEFENDPWWKYKSASELLQNPKLFEAEKKYAQMQNEFDGKPIDPVFDLPEDQRNIVLAKKLKLPGSKDEGFNTLYNQEWYQDYRGKQDAYYAAKKEYNKSRGFKEQEVDNPYPEATGEVQKAMDFYMKLPKGTGQRSGFIRNNPEIWAKITAQWKAQDQWTDKEREKLGLPAIPRDDKKTNNYASSGRKGGKKGTKVRVSTDVLPKDFVKGLKVSTAKAPTSSLRIVQAKKPTKAKVKISAKAKTIKKS